MPEEKSVVCCPKRKKPVEARYNASHPIGSVLPTIQCSCGYKGLPIKMTLKEYTEWRK